MAQKNLLIILAIVLTGVVVVVGGLAYDRFTDRRDERRRHHYRTEGMPIKVRMLEIRSSGLMLIEVIPSDINGRFNTEHVYHAILPAHWGWFIPEDGTTIECVHLFSSPNHREAPQPLRIGYIASAEFPEASVAAEYLALASKPS